MNASALLGLLTGPLACLSPLPVVEGEEGRSWVAVSGPDLRSPVPRLGASVGAVGLLTQQMLSLRLPGVCSASGSPRGGEGSAAAALRAPLPARVRERPSVVPLERSRSSLRCLRPSGGVVSLNPGVLLGSPPRWCVCVSREWLSSGGGVEAVGEACLCSSSWSPFKLCIQGRCLPANFSLSPGLLTSASQCLSQCLRYSRYSRNAYKCKNAGKDNG